MASILSVIPCPHCGCCATVDDYYKIDEKMIWCFRCGYFYEKVTKYEEETDEFRLEENEYEGYGKCVLWTKNGKLKKNVIFQRELSEEEITIYLELMRENDIDLNQSYFVLFSKGEFKFLAGKVDEDFYVPFEEYKARKEEKGEDVEIIVPM